MKILPKGSPRQTPIQQIILSWVFIGFLSLGMLQFFLQSDASMSDCHHPDIEAVGNNDYTPRNGEVVRIAGTYTGTLIIDQPNVTVCITAEGDYQHAHLMVRGADFTLINEGKLSMASRIEMGNGVMIQNKGSLSTRGLTHLGNGSMIANSGIWNVNDELAVLSGARINNTGYVSFNHHNLTLTGTWQNLPEGVVDSLDMLTIDVAGKLENAGTLTVWRSTGPAVEVHTEGSLINQASGVFYVPHSALTVEAADKAVINAGKIQVHSFSHNQGTLINHASGLIEITHDLTNSGPLVNHGKVYVGGDFLHQSKGKAASFVNNGYTAIGGNFTVANASYLNGTGGIAVAGRSTSHGYITSVDICDEGNGNIDQDFSTINTSTTCAYSLEAPFSGLSSFVGNFRDGAIELQWTTAEHANYAYFEVQREIGEGRELVGKVAGVGESAALRYFRFMDRWPVGTSVARYRLVQVDQAGMVTPSDWIVVRKVGIENLSIQLIPNPARKEVEVSVAKIESLVSVSVSNLDGRRLIYQETKKPNLHRLKLNTKGLPMGLYTVEVVSNKGVGTRRLQIVP